jgi:hypothetical protein
MPKKKYLFLLRNCKVLNFQENQTPYFQGQSITNSESGSGVYLVRKGEFAYYYSEKQKETEVNYN